MKQINTLAEFNQAEVESKNDSTVENLKLKRSEYKIAGSTKLQVKLLIFIKTEAKVVAVMFKYNLSFYQN